MRTLICVKNDRSNPIVGFCLFGLYLNLMKSTNIDVLIIDNSVSGIFDEPFTRVVYDLLSSVCKVIYLRDTKEMTVGELQYKHYKYAINNNYEYLYWLDGDIFLEWPAVETMVSAISRDYGFIQGSKIDIDRGQNYHQDINKLNYHNQSSDMVELFFGDTSNIIIPVDNLADIDWGVVIDIKDKKCITGTDSLITGQIDKPSYGLPYVSGWHLSYGTRTQKAEIYADWLRVETLKDIIPYSKLQKMYPTLPL